MADFQALIKQRMAEHANQYIDHLLKASQAPVKKKPLSNTQRHYKWLANFERKHGMPYTTYIKMVKAGNMPPMEKVDNRFISHDTQEPFGSDAGMLNESNREPAKLETGI